MEQERDIAAIRRILAGEHEAYSQLVDRYRNLVYTLCLRMLSDPVEAEEAAQESFIKAYQALNRFQQRSRFSTWLYRIAYNHCVSVLRSNVKLFDLVDEGAEAEAGSYELDGLESLSRQERTLWLQKAMEALAETDAVVLTLFYYEEHSLEEIAEVTGMSDANVRVRLHRARLRLKKELSKKLNKELSSIL